MAFCTMMDNLKTLNYLLLLFFLIVKMLNQSTFNLFDTDLKVTALIWPYILLGHKIPEISVTVTTVLIEPVHK